MSGYFTEVRQALTMTQVAECFGYHPTRSGFISLRDEKTPSCKLYKDHYHDFGDGSHGDVIDFAALELRSGKKDACAFLIQYFGLNISMEYDRASSQQHFAKMQAERKAEQAEKQRFNAYLSKERRNLQEWEKLYSDVLKRGGVDPFGETGAFIINERIKITVLLSWLDEAPDQEIRDWINAKHEGDPEFIKICWPKDQPTAKGSPGDPLIFQ